MKIAAGLVIAVNALDIDRKVPPRHPKNRLARLEKFCEAMTMASWVKVDRFSRMNARCEGWANARYAAFEKCGFYSSDVSHGGPDPSVEYKETENSYWGGRREKVNLFEDRKRRSADDCSSWDGNMDNINYFNFHDVIEKETVRVQGDEPCAPDYIDPAWLGDDYVKSIQAELNEECIDDCQNEADVDACEAKCSQVSRSSGSRVRRIENRGPWKSARSIVTGMRKWGERYLAECAGRRSGRHMVRRHNFMKTCTRKFVPGLCSHSDCTEDYARNFNWGGKNLRLENPYLN